MRSLALVAVLVLTACGSSKEPAYFALGQRPAPARAGAPPMIELRRPGIAGYLDRADIVTKVKEYQLQIDTSERWAEPFGDMVGRVLAQDLASRLGGSQVFVENGPISAVPDSVVAIELQTFDADANGDVHLVAEVVLEAPKGQRPARAQRITLQARPDGGSTAALVACMSTLLGQLADAIASMLIAG